MRKTALMTKVAIASLLLAGAANVPLAFAQKGNMMEPLSKWSVSKIDGAHAGGRPYCAMARRYSKNLILTFAQNKAHESSLALDFQGSSFKAQQMFSLVLDPGAGELRKFEMRPASENAFVVRLGNDDKFFSALKTTGFLRVELDNRQYHFDIGDIDDGKHELDGCLAYLDVEPVYGIEGYGSEKSWSAAASPEKYEEALSELRSHISELQQQNRDLAQKIEYNRDAVNSQQGVNAGEPFDEKAADQATAAPEKDDHSLLQRIGDVNAGLEPQAGEESGGGEDITAPVPLSTPQAAASPAPPTAELNSEAAALEAKNKALMARIDALRQKTKQEFDKLLEDQRQENEALKVALANAGKTKSQSDVLKLQEAIVTLERQKEELSDKMKLLESANAEMNNQVAGQGGVEALEARNAELQKIIELAGTALNPAAVTASASSVSSVPKVVADTRMPDMPAVAPPAAQSQPIPVAVEEPPISDADRLMKMEAKIEAMEAINRELHAALNATTEKANAFEKEIKDRQAAYQKLQDENKKLREQLAQAQTQSSGANEEKIAALVAENKELKDNVRRLSDDLIQIRRQLAHFESNMGQGKAQDNAASMVSGAVKEEAAAPADAVAETARLVPPAPPRKIERPQAPAVLDDSEFASEAQKYEAELARSIQDRGAAVAGQQEPPAEVETVAIAPETMGKEQIKQLDIKPLREEPKEESVEINWSQPRAEVNAMPKEATPPQAPQEALAAADAAPKPLAAQSYKFTPDFDIQHILNDAHVTVPEHVQKVENTGDKNQLAYRWQEHGIFGSAELKPIMSVSKQFDDFVYEYLNITQERCDGQFAVVPERTVETVNLRLDSYEIACVGGRVDSTASLLFFSRDDTFTVLAQETQMEQMPAVMEARDRLIRMLENESSGKS